MDVRNYTKEKLIEMAYNSSEHKVLEKLITHNNMSIRRAVARNTNAPRIILDKLADDPVQNVSYMASKNPNCINPKVFKDNLPVCVVCNIDERKQDCEGCIKLARQNG